MQQEPLILDEKLVEQKNGTETVIPTPVAALAQKTCKDCSLYVGQTPTAGNCRRYPPQAILVGMVQHPVTRQQQAVVEGFWPSVHPVKSWCAELVPMPVPSP